MVDVVLSLLALPVLALVTLVMAAIMQLVAPGPVFYLQERVGFRGQRFRIFKFRTMKVAADSTVHNHHVEQLISTNAPMVKMDAKGDGRLIPLGWLMRALGLDELPQIINVLRGEMSLVGPRPCLPSEYPHYSPEQRKRFLATPGLTGLWQVSGKNRTTFCEMVALDIRYTERQSLGLDLMIMARTFPALAMQLVDTWKGRKTIYTSSRMTEIPFPISSVTEKLK